ncbi:MAG: ceramide glucosyltransferase [Pseudorhodobacter sp.]|nr:ceramide glucosyltransferase [Pseudorhodobacter sp.]
MNALAVGLMFFAILALAVHLVSALLAVRGVRARLRQVVPSGLPPITLLRPVCGLDRFDAETLASSFLLNYPQYEVIFCAARADDAAVALVGRLIAANPTVNARLLIGDERSSRNPKLNNLAKGWRDARHAHVCMADSNLLLPPDYLREVVAAWDERTGLVSSPPVGIWPDGMAARLECAFLNGNQARIQLAADTLGLGFAQGKTLFWRRDLLDRAGGFAALGRNMAEDVAATKMVRSLGLKVRLTPVPFFQPIGRRRLADVWARQVRWSVVRRDGFPALFMLEPLNGAVLPTVALTAGLLLAGLTPFWLLSWLVIWYGTEVILARVNGWPVAVSDVVALPLRDLMIQAVWLFTLRRSGFEWRGTPMSQIIAAPGEGGTRD